MILSWPKGYGLKTFDVIDSTNEEAKRLAAAGEAGPIWISAARQTQGRGRRGRAWESPTGNLSATLMLRPAKSAGECAQLSFAAAIAACDMLQHFAPNAALRVKWPNDVLADGRKLVGILLESASKAGESVPDYLAIGIGANLATHPEGLEYPVTSLKALGAPVPGADDALLHLAANFARWYDAWAADGFAALRDAWLARAQGLGSRIRARLATEETAGVFQGIDATGALLLKEDAGRIRAISAGEVFFA
ncbi:MAG TPA: biotin--[acetyl-CoA-carboxylase] ligase [Rhizomicrobium sp.]|jgi:BirA family biotin operon repressor/biotin-[acetyl-CoA-carboxylase] ligase|nr:biotin--[acetyl-CoA-carboxylase] ligase [Rhizomicrobium sp.]